MESALAERQTDMIGAARPFCIDPAWSGIQPAFSVGRALLNGGIERHFGADRYAAWVRANCQRWMRAAFPEAQSDNRN